MFQDGVYSLGWKSLKITQKIVKIVNRWFFPHNFAKNAGDKLPHYTQGLRLLRAEEILLKSQNTFQADFHCFDWKSGLSNLVWLEILRDAMVLPLGRSMLWRPLSFLMLSLGERNHKQKP